MRLLVSTPGDVVHARFRELPRFLRPGDLVVVNTSATLPAAVDGQRPGGRPVTVHFSTALPSGQWAVEVRPAQRATGPVRDAAPGDVVGLPDGHLTLVAPYAMSGSPATRLWRAHVELREPVQRYLARHGRPISYGYVPKRWPLGRYQTVFARTPGSAEMPSAGRPFTPEIVTELVTAGVGMAPLTLHTGVSSLEKGEPPLPEPYDVPEMTARLVNLTLDAGGRVVAVGTTVTRALETVATAQGRVEPASGWTDLVLGPETPARVVGGLVTGWHEPGASHLQLLDAVVGHSVVAAAYDAARRAGYLWHEFGDSALLLA